MVRRADRQVVDRLIDDDQNEPLLSNINLVPHSLFRRKKRVPREILHARAHQVK